GETAALRPLPASPQTDLGLAAGHHAYSSVDRAFKANLARLTLGLSPAVLAEQTFDWLTDLEVDPENGTGALIGTGPFPSW
ncbi:MAG TPA: poly-beta-hydroxybutyrate polymerase N-terminal domain-containing protein, partial [Novosphingobium sp.]|nr:poly-beta-hydroxybutyrate polymerase N-terminal domain-containing protein [Novosphingobium sp.]